MSVTKNHISKYRHSSLQIDPESTSHELWNDGTELLRYARGLTAMLADLIHEADAVNCRKMAHSLEGIDVLMQLGLECATQAHACVTLELRNALLPQASD